jgi:hypothetical protein
VRRQVGGNGRLVDGTPVRWLRNVLGALRTSADRREYSKRVDMNGGGAAKGSVLLAVLDWESRLERSVLRLHLHA